MGRVWLHENMGMLTLSYEAKAPRPDKPPQPSDWTYEYLWSNNEYFQMRDEEGNIPAKVPHDASGDEMLGFDGASYPMPNKQ